MNGACFADLTRVANRFLRGALPLVVRQETVTSIRRGLARSSLGMRNVSTPSFIVASIAAGSSSLLSSNTRR